MIVGPRYNDVDPAVEAAYELDEKADMGGCSDECDNCDSTTDVDPASGFCPTCLWTTEGASS